MDLHQIVVARTLNASAELSFDFWIEEVFFQGGGLGKPKIINRGTDEALVGSRKVVSFGIHEEIVFTSKPNKIIYKVVQGPFPVAFHEGIVEFFPDLKNQNQTEIKWTCNFIPSTWANYFLAGSYGLSFIIRNSLEIMVAKLQSEVNKNYPGNDDTKVDKS